jgi:hypothetical protein
VFSVSQPAAAAPTQSANCALLMMGAPALTKAILTVRASMASTEEMPLKAP